MKTRDSSPPVHVHVSEKTPVHVHRMRSPSRKTTSSRIRTRDTTPDAGNHYPSARSKSRSPWIPPGRVSSRGDVGSYKWQRFTQPFASGAHGNLGNKEDAEDGYWSCEKRGSKIDRLMMDAGTPKNEPKLRMKDSRLGSTEEEELVAASKDLNIRSDSAVQHGDIDLLLRTLVEAEIDGVSIVNQLSALKDTVDSLPKDKRLSKMDAVSLGRQRELLLEKIEIFDNTNRILRERLREWRDYEKDELTKRVADCEAENNVLLANLNNKEKEATKLAELLELQKDSVMTTAELSKTLQSSRTDLETQLLMKEAENNHLAAQIQRMEQNYSYQRQELKSLQEELQTLRQQREEDRERQSVETITLLKHQAEQAQEAARQLTTQLQEKETQLAEAFSASKDWRAHHSKEVAVKTQLEDEITHLKTQVTELTTKLHAEEDKGRAAREELLEQLHNLNTESTSTKLENQRLKASLASSEETLRYVQSEVIQLKTSVRKHESLVDKYKTKVHQARLESEEQRLRLEVAQKEARDVKGDLEREIDQVRRQLVCRLQDLEPLPERLRHSEAQLREAQEQALAQGRRSAEQSTALSDLRHKVEQQGSRLETFQQKNVILQEENNLLKENVENLQRKLEETTFDNKDKAQVVVIKEATIKNLQQQLEERTSDCSLLSRQLEHALEDSKRQMDESMQRAFSKERCSQSKALDLESQLSIARTELTQLNRSKEEMERRFQSQLKNVKDRLEQSDCTNRSLQNYVHFLKASYGNVFGDSLLAN